MQLGNRGMTLAILSLSLALKERYNYRLMVDCLTPQQCAIVSQRPISCDKCTCFHTEAADQTGYLTQLQCTVAGPASPSIDPITPGAWQGNHLRSKVYISGETRPGTSLTERAGLERGSVRLEVDALPLGHRGGGP